MLATCWYSSSVSQTKEIVTVRFCFDDMHVTLQPGGTATDSKPSGVSSSAVRGHHPEIGWAGGTGAARLRGATAGQMVVVRLAWGCGKVIDRIDDSEVRPAPRSGRQRGGELGSLGSMLRSEVVTT